MFSERLLPGCPISSGLGDGSAQLNEVLIDDALDLPEKLPSPERSEGIEQKSHRRKAVSQPKRDRSR